MQILKSSSIFSPSCFLKHRAFIFIQSYSSSTSISNLPLFNYLVKNLDFSETLALPISNRYSHVKYFVKAQSVANFLQSLGFPNAQIASSARLMPQILFADVEKLRPKIKLFQYLGVAESDLGKFFSRNSTLLTCSLEKKLIPSVHFVKKVLGDDNEDAIKVLNRCNGFIARDSILKLSKNIEYLESCRIVGSQLSKLLTRQPRIFRMQESALRDLISKVLDMGFSTNSRMLMHAIHTMNCLSEQKFKKKWELLKSFGFSDSDCMNLFRKAPVVFRASEEKIKLGIEFFFNVAKFDKSVLLCRPYLLMNSLEDRVIPRYKVFQIVESKKLLKKNWGFLYILDLTENEFLQFMSRFPDDVEELLTAYKAHHVHTCSSLSSEEKT